MVPTPLRAVLFDWDGTLADTAEATYRCYVRTFAEFGLDFDRQTYRRTYSPNWYLTFEALGLPETRWAEADARWLAHFAEESTALIAGAREALDVLARNGIAAALVTSGSRPRIERELEAHGVRDRFAGLVCGSDTERKKPHPDPLLVALDALGIAAKEAAYVGDSAEDVLMAKAANVFAVAIPGGYPNHEPLQAAPADLRAGDLASAIQKLIA